MNTSKLNSNRVMLLLYVLIALFYIISLLYSPVGYDESKYYIVSKYIDMGRVPWMDIHPGSVGVHFYQLYDLWFDFVGNSFYSARLLSLVLSIAAIAAVLRLLQLLKLNNYAIFAWVLLYALNPFYGYLNVIVSHVSITNSLFIITASYQIQLMLHLKQNIKNNRMILIAIVAGISAASLVLIRPYQLIGVLALFAFLSYYVISSKRYKLFIIFVFSSLLLLLGSIYIQSISEAKYNYLQSHPVAKEQQKVDRIVSIRTTKLNNIDSLNIDSLNIVNINKSSNEIHTNDKIKEEQIVLDLELPSELVHRLDTAQTMLGKVSHHIKRILNPEVINPLLKQLAGYMVSPLFIYYLIGVVAIPFLLRNGYMIRNLNIVKIIIVVSTIVILPLLIVRYSKNSSFTYLVHGLSLLSLVPAITLSSILNKAGDNTKILKRLLLGIIAIVTLQAHIFNTPENYMHNPLNGIIKDSFKQGGENPHSITSTKEVAKIIDSNTLPGDKVLFDQYSPLVFSKSIAVPGLEMNLYDGFFDKKKWVNVKKI